MNLTFPLPLTSCAPPTLPPAWLACRRAQALYISLSLSLYLSTSFSVPVSVSVTLSVSVSVTCLCHLQLKHLKVEFTRGDGAVKRREEQRQQAAKNNPSTTLFVVGFDPERIRTAGMAPTPPPPHPQPSHTHLNTSTKVEKYATNPNQHKTPACCSTRKKKSNKNLFKKKSF